jgi:hypothetical protein
MMMMSLQQRITAFVQLGHGLRALAASPDWPGFACGLTREEFDQVRSLMDTVKARNGWFTPEAVVQSFAAWGENLREEPLRQWLSVYQLPEIQESPATVAVICAGNIPMVGFHDVLSILITGHRALIKYSSDDDVLIPAVLQLLVRIEPGFAPMIAWAEGKLHNFDAVIATGSTNTSRYFHQYFSAYPHIIRTGRTSVAVLTGDETEEELLDRLEMVLRRSGTDYEVERISRGDFFLLPNKPLDQMLNESDTRFEQLITHKNVKRLT